MKGYLIFDSKGLPIYPIFTTKSLTIRYFLIGSPFKWNEHTKKGITCKQVDIKI